jgi:hypothetical protein
MVSVALAALGAEGEAFQKSPASLTVDVSPPKLELEGTVGLCEIYSAADAREIVLSKLTGVGVVRYGLRRSWHLRYR